MGFEGCSKKFMELKHLTAHLKEHTKPFKCTVCYRSFGKKYDLKIHCRLHSDELVEKCKLCKMTFKDPANLRKHVKNIHQNKDKPKPFSCRYCHKQFSRKESLKKHFQIHLKERMVYECKQCETCFTLKHNLNKHMKKYH